MENVLLLCAARNSTTFLRVHDDVLKKSDHNGPVTCVDTNHTLLLYLSCRFYYCYYYIC